MTGAFDLFNVTSKHVTALKSILNGTNDGKSKGSFKRTFNVTVFVSGTFDLFDVMCKQRHRTVLNPFFNGMKNGDIDGNCKRSLKKV